MHGEENGEKGEWGKNGRIEGREDAYLQCNNADFRLQRNRTIANLTHQTWVCFLVSHSDLTW